MTIFVYEYLTALGASNDRRSLLAPSLLREGRAMFDAVVADFGALAEVRTLAAEDEKRFRALAATSDYSLIIAPESEGILERRCRWVEEAGGRLLGPSSQAVRLTADKCALAKHLQSGNFEASGLTLPLALQREGRVGAERIVHPQASAYSQPFPPPCPPPAKPGGGWERYPGLPESGDAHTKGIRTPATSLNDQGSLPYPVVWKPRDGAGSQFTFLLRTASEYMEAKQQMAKEPNRPPMIFQEYIEGLPVSVALLMGHQACIALAPCTQHLSDDGRFHYYGGSTPLAPDLADRAKKLALRAAACVDGLFGYIGIDLVLGKNAAEDAVIEINPRLTTSYIGLRQAARFSIAQALLDIVQDKAVPLVEWKRETIHFAFA